MKNAITVAIVPDFASLAKRVKFGVAVPPDTKEPMTRPAPPMTLKDPLERTGYLQNRLLGRLNMEDYDLITQSTADTPVP